MTSLLPSFPLARFNVYSSKDSPAHLCVVSARDRNNALQVARTIWNLGRTAHAVPERAEVNSLLWQGLTLSCIKAGWLKPCASDPKSKKRKLYAMRDVETCENNLQTGLWPLEK
jgi:hypothetical protein